MQLASQELSPPQTVWGGRGRYAQGCGERATGRPPQAARLALGRQLRPSSEQFRGAPSKPQSRPQRGLRGGRGGGGEARDTKNRRREADALNPAPRPTGCSVEHDDARRNIPIGVIQQQRVRVGRHDHDGKACTGLQVDGADERPVGRPPLLQHSRGWLIPDQ